MVARQEDTFKAKEEELREAVERVKGLEGKLKDLEGKMATLSQEKNDLALALAAVSARLHTVQFTWDSDNHDLGPWAQSHHRPHPHTHTVTGGYTHTTHYYTAYTVSL